MRFAGLLAGVVGLALLISSCGGGNAASQFAKPPEFQPNGQTKCSVAKSQAKPLIVEWPSADRGELETQAHNRGLVVVRYSGCEVQLLDRCTTTVKYAYSPMTRKRDRVVIRDDDDLYANVPVGAAKLEAKLKTSGELEVNMTLVGRWEADRASVGPEELQGDCDGATHVVSGLTVGAFTFTAGGAAEVGGEVSALGANVGATSTSKREMLNADGDEAACEKSKEDDSKPPPGCGALLRMEVVPIAGVGQRPGNLVVRTAPSPVGPPIVASPTRAPMVSLAGGTYTLGERRDTVAVPPFAIDVTEVTVDAYAECVQAGACTVDHLGEWTLGGSTFVADAYCNYGVAGKGNHPMNCVDWQQAWTYCRAQGKRLPTEEEWEWAARGGALARVYPWGQPGAGSQLCWSGIVNRKGTCPVGSSPSGDTPEGIHDLAGNVAEWTSSPYTSTSNTRVTRGGGWNYSDLEGVRAASRHSHAPADRVDHLGFRCAR